VCIAAHEGIIGRMSIGRQPVTAATRLWMRQCELSDLLDRLDRERVPAHHTDAQHPADPRADRLRALAEHELDEIDAALARIAAGTYGLCTQCDGPIESTRRAILPQSTLCASCARDARFEF
jgi:DnaK suppressor protein